MNTPNERIKLLRKEKGMLQDDVATLINSSRFNISRYENGIPIPSEVIAAYARTFDVSADWLLCLTSDRKTGGSDLTVSIDELAELTSKAGGVPLSADQLMQLLDALLLYYRAGASAGDAPVDVLIVFINALTAAVNAARAGSTGDLLIATNAVASAGIQAQSILASFLQQQEK